MPALLVDLDDTLLDDRGAMSFAVLRLREAHGFVPGVGDQLLASQWDSATRSQWLRLAAGEVTFAEQRRARLREVFALQLSDAAADSLFAEYLIFYEQAWVLLPGASEFLAATTHLPRVILTNGNRAQAQRKLNKLGLADQFQALVTPDDCGARKPDPRIFLHALGLLGVQAGEALMVGDNFEADIKPALSLGMRAFHVRPNVPGQSISAAAGAA